MKYLLIILLPLTLFACDERYRYPCQDPENWETKQCQKPFCSANGTCPEDLKHYVKDKTGQPLQPQQPVSSKGDCK
jgi:hypothetical protein